MRKRIHPGLLLAAVVALCASSAGTARAQQEIPAPDPAPTPFLALEGRPEAYRPYANLDYFLWHDGFGWHLRATTSGHYHRFKGVIEAQQGVSDVRPLEPSVALNIMGNRIQFEFAVSGGEKGFDWQSPGTGCARYNLFIDGQDRPGKITVGASQGHPGFGGFELCAGGGPEQAAEPDDADEVAAAEGPEVEVDSFHSALSPYGEWVDVPGYGMIWRPYANVVGPDFTPYGTSGHWVYTDAGWMWASGYSWGWAPFHYGNWVYAGGGWGWVPGRVWAPAWVEWRSGGGYVGWAPAQPVGVVSVTVINTQPRYCYVQTNNFTQVNVQSHVIVGAQAQVVYAQTQPLPSARVVNGHPITPVNAGPQPAVISQATGHPVTAVAVHTVTASVPPQNVQGVHYAAGASAQHPVAVKPLPPATAKQYVAASRASGVAMPAAHAASATAATHSSAVPATSSAAHVQPNAAQPEHGMSSMSSQPTHSVAPVETGHPTAPVGSSQAAHPATPAAPEGAKAAAPTEAHPAAHAPPAAKPKPPPAKPAPKKKN
jgi:hypothetical protein